MQFTTDPAARQAYITGLRALADYLDQHPAVPVPRFGTEIRMTADSTETGGCRQVDEFACQLGIAAPATISDLGHYQAIRYFGPVGYRMTATSDHAKARHRTARTDRCAVPDTWT